MSRLDDVRRIYQNHPATPWDDLWYYGSHADRRINRFYRFRALQTWAELKREEGNRDGDTWKQWDNRHDAYRNQKYKIWRRIRRARRRNQDHGLGSVEVNPTNRGGSGSVLQQFVEPFMQRRGLSLGSGMRTPAENAAVGGSPSSDHLTTNYTAIARDFPTYSGEDDARALANAFSRAWSPNSYAAFYVSVDGYNFRVQILWGSGIGHADHVHVGIKRA